MPIAASGSSIGRQQRASAAEQLPPVKQEDNADAATDMQIDGSPAAEAGAAAAAKVTSQPPPVKQERVATAATAAPVDPTDGVIDLCSDSGDNDGDNDGDDRPPPSQAAQPPPSDWGRLAGEGGGIPGL